MADNKLVDRQQLLEFVYTGAQAAVLRQKRPYELSDIQMQSVLGMESIKYIEELRGGLRSLSAMLVAKIAREDLYLYYPPDDEHPDGFENLRDFLRASGLDGSTLSDMDAIGTIIVPYCDDNGLDIDDGITESAWPKLREAIPALRAAVELDNRQAIRDIIEDSNKVPTRDAMRRKYRTQVKSKVGKGTTASTKKGKAIILLVPDEGDVQTVLSSLNGNIEWNLSIGVQDTKNNTRIVL